MVLDSMKAKSVLDAPDFDVTAFVTSIPNRTHRESSGCLIWTGNNSGRGYGCLSYNRTRYSAHRAVYECVVGPIEEGLELMHSCDNPACVAVEHLRPGTHAENMADMSAKKRGSFGERNSNVKLTREQILEIVAKRQGGQECDALAKEYNVSASAISMIVRGLRWSHVDRPVVYAGRGTVGEKHGASKLTADDVREIRRRAAEGERQADIGEDFSVGRTHVSKIVRGVLWKSVA